MEVDEEARRRHGQSEATRSMARQFAANSSVRYRHSVSPAFWPEAYRPDDLEDIFTSTDFDPSFSMRNAFWMAEAPKLALRAARASTLIMGECGQANMPLASYLGVDLTHDGLHRYRLLDLDTTLHGLRPKVGDALSVEIRMERQAVADGLRILFLASDIHVGGELRSPGRFRAGLFLLHAVPQFDPTGGQWGRGYPKAVQKLSPQDWIFAAHFPDAPCVPGFILLEGAVQALAFQLTALGLTLDRNGWHFEMRPETTYTVRFRGHIVPQIADLTYEVFIEAVADITCRLDDRTIFHARQVMFGLVTENGLAGKNSVPE